MSTDTELTFIRCPSCRSLVPAVSPRCRMCGAVLDGGKSDAAGSSDDSNASKKIPSRVRQQTVAVSDQDVKAAKEAFGKSDQSYNKYPASAPVNEAPKFEAQEEEADPFEDIVSEPEDFTTEQSDFDIGMDEEQQAASDSEVEESTDFGDPLGAFIEEVPVEDSISSPLQSAPVNEMNGNGFHEEPQAAMEEEEVAPPAPEPKVTFQPKRTEVKASGEQRSRVVIESGNRRQSAQKGNLSFGKNRSEAVKRPVSEEVSAVQEAPAVTEPVRVKQERKTESPVMETEAATNSYEAPRSETVKPAVSSGPKVNDAASKGRLYGWLVSYSDPRGIANELRDGKFFVSRSSLKGTDLILDDDSISTPHALVGVNVNDGLMVQDLMSDRGVFVRRRAGEAYQRVLESTKLEHGDWVRFGDVEFLVAIIATPAGR